MSNFLHAGDAGDLIAALPIIKHIGGGNLYLQTTGPAREPFTPAKMEFLRPLLLAQDYIRTVEIHRGQAVKYNFTKFRQCCEKDITLTEAQRRHIIPITIVNTKDPWLTHEIPPSAYAGAIVVARSPRYHNPNWDKVWPLVLQLEETPIFVGLKAEHDDFQARFGPIHYVKVDNALELASLIQNSSLFVGNQSFPWWIAEGLKVKSILEVCLHAQDCCFPRPNVNHVRTAEDWPGTKPPRLILALQTHPGDLDAARDLAGLLAQIQTVWSEEHEFALCVRDDVPEREAERIAMTLRAKFRTHILRSQRGGRNWPNGCNDLWQESMVALGKMAREGKTEAEAVLTFEPDCVPLRRSWIDLLAKEWTNTNAEGRMAFGAMTVAGNNGQHLNGNMVLDIAAMKKHPELQTADRSWDMHHRKLFLEHGRDSNLICNEFYQQLLTVTSEQLFALRKGGKLPPSSTGSRTTVPGKPCGKPFWLAPFRHEQAIQS